MKLETATERVLALLLKEVLESRAAYVAAHDALKEHKDRIRDVEESAEALLTDLGVNIKKEEDQ